MAHWNICQWPTGSREIRTAWGESPSDGVEVNVCQSFQGVGNLFETGWSGSGQIAFIPHHFAEKTISSIWLFPFLKKSRDFWAYPQGAKEEPTATDFEVVPC